MLVTERVRATRRQVRGRGGGVADWMSNQPAYQQVAEVLRGQIASGDLRDGDRLPSYADIMRKFDVSVTVARSAIGLLRGEGLVSTHQGKGAFVRPGASAAAAPAAERGEVAALRHELAALAQRVERLEGKTG